MLSAIGARCNLRSQQLPLSAIGALSNWRSLQSALSAIGALSKVVLFGIGAGYISITELSVLIKLGLSKCIAVYPSVFPLTSPVHDMGHWGILRPVVDISLVAYLFSNKSLDFTASSNAAPSIPVFFDDGSSSPTDSCQLRGRPGACKEIVECPEHLASLRARNLTALQAAVSNCGTKLVQNRPRPVQLLVSGVSCFGLISAEGDLFIVYLCTIYLFMYFYLFMYRKTG